MYGLTPRERDALQFIRQYFAARGIPPTYAEIQAHLGLASKSGVHKLVEGLVERGAVRRLRNRARSIEIVDHGSRTIMDALPPKVLTALYAHCQKTGEPPIDVIADALVLFFDQAEADAERELHFRDHAETPS